MTSISKFFSGGSSEVPLGMSTQFPSLTPSTTQWAGRPNVSVGAQEFLRSGAYTLAANADPKVQQMKHLQLFSTKEGVFPAGQTSIGATTIACNNAGVRVAVGNKSKIYYSTDGGKTWKVPVSDTVTGSSFSHVIWTGSNFVAVQGSGGTSPWAVTSVDGVTWVAATGLPAAARTSGLIHDGQGRVVILIYGAQGNATTNYISTNHGSSWTSFYLPSPIDSGFHINGSWVFLRPSNDSYYTAPVASPSVTTTRYLPIAFSGDFYRSASNGVNLACTIISSALYTTVDGITWKKYGYIYQDSVDTVYFAGGKFWFAGSFSAGTGQEPLLPLGIVYSSDLINFVYKEFVPALVGTQMSSTVTRLIGVSNSQELYWGTSGNNSKCINYWEFTETPDYIGTNRETWTDTTKHRHYWRIK